jgi:hypothetical protein
MTPVASLADQQIARGALVGSSRRYQRSAQSPSLGMRARDATAKRHASGGFEFEAASDRRTHVFREFAFAGAEFEH